MKTTRREATAVLATLAASAAANADERPYEPQTFSARTFERLGLLADTILPRTDTPGAHEAGVTRIVDEDAAADAALQRRVENLASRFAADGFFDGEEPQRIALMADYMTDPGERGELFTFLKNLVVERYYSTEIGLARELGYQGNTFLASFPGCQHDHELEELVHEQPVLGEGA